VAQSQRIDDRRHDVTDVTCQPARAQLRPAIPAHVAERCDLSTRHALPRRVHSEFLEMPGLTLSIEQAARLFSLPSGVCARVLGELIAGDLLRRTTDGRYALARRSA
jgi:hypothetical protein